MGKAPRHRRPGLALGTGAPRLDKLISLLEYLGGQGSALVAGHGSAFRYGALAQNVQESSGNRPEDRPRNAQLPCLVLSSSLGS